MSGAGTGPQPGAALCRACGLCCDGSLFRAVELGADDSLPGAATLQDQLPQPCAFHSAGACNIYASRPGQCRAFVCRVLAAVQAGERDIGWARARIEAMRHLLAGLGDVLPGEGGLYARAAAYLEDAATLPDDARIRARIAVYREMIDDFRPLSERTDPPDPSRTPG